MWNIVLFIFADRKKQEASSGVYGNFFKKFVVIRHQELVT